VTNPTPPRTSLLIHTFAMGSVSGGFHYVVRSPPVSMSAYKRLNPFSPSNDMVLSLDPVRLQHGILSIRVGTFKESSHETESVLDVPAWVFDIGVRQDYYRVQ
jgi:hypothetical protein